MAGPLVADTGGLLRAVATRPDGRPTWPEFERALRAASRVIVPALVLAEVDYFLRDNRPAMQELVADIFEQWRSTQSSTQWRSGSLTELWQPSQSAFAFTASSPSTTKTSGHCVLVSGSLRDSISFPSVRPSKRPATARVRRGSRRERRRPR